MPSIDEVEFFNVTDGMDIPTFVVDLDHPFQREILALRQIILGADPAIAEEIKWNAPSFRTSEFFATLNIRAEDAAQVILHFGAKKRASTGTRDAIPDPDSMLQWLTDDRASVKFRDMSHIDEKRAAFSDLVAQWIRHVPTEK